MSDASDSDYLVPDNGADSSDSDFDDSVEIKQSRKPLRKARRRRTSLPDRRTINLVSDSDEADTGMGEEDEADEEEIGAVEEFARMEAHSDLVTSLLPFQKESLHWMTKQEHRPVRGGILADEMGMGKTIQSIALIVTNRNDVLLKDLKPTLNLDCNPDITSHPYYHLPKNFAAYRKAQEEEEKKKRKGKGKRKPLSLMGHMDPGPDVEPCNPTVASDPLYPFSPTGKPCKTTLVVCPVVALTQWRDELLRHTVPGALNVHIHHGPKRTKDPKDLMQYDVVITTYSVLEVEYRKMMEPTKISCPYCGKPFNADRLRVHLKYFCGPDAVRTEAQKKTEKKSRKIASEFAARVAGKVKGGDTTLRKAPSKRKPRGRRRAASSDEDEGEEEDDEAYRQPRQQGSSKGKKPTPSKKTTSFEALPPSPAKVAATSRKRQKVEPPPSPDTPTGRPRRSAAISAASAIKKMSTSAPLYVATETASDSEDWPKKPSAVVNSKGSSGAKGKDKGGKSAGRASKRPKAASTPSTSEMSLEDVHEELVSRSEEQQQLGPISVLQAIHWRRVILDEAHAIKNRRSTTAKAAFSLTAERRWCLSGTPLQNRVGELYSLLRFLRIFPYCYYFCRRNNCCSLDYTLTSRGCKHCDGSPMIHYCWWNKYISNPIMSYGYIGKGADAMQLLRNRLLKNLLLRRTKRSRAADMALPSKVITLRQDLMDPFELDFYEALYTQSKSKFNTYVDSNTVLNNYAHIFDLLIRLRQAVNHPWLVLHSSSAAGAAANASCGICNEVPEDGIVSQCDHMFCRQCVKDLLTSRGDSPDKGKYRVSRTAASGSEEEEEEEEEEEDDSDSGVKGKAGRSDFGVECPVCSEPLTADLNQPTVELKLPKRGSSIISRLPDAKLGAGFKSSTKIEALLEQVCRCKEEDPSVKVLVFSQFVNMLDLIKYRFDLAGIKSVKMHGGMSAKARDKTIQEFTKSPDVTAFLISLKAGGVALNLTVASQIMIMDPWWNPAAEDQAMDRTHRIGQHKPITTTRFIIKDTVEERILALQEKKKLVFQGTVGQDQGSLTKLTEDDMRFLFSR